MDSIAALYVSETSSSSSSSESSDDEAAVASVNDRESSARRKRKRDDNEALPAWTRAFAHVDGNWPSHVSIAIQGDDELRAACSRVIKRAQQCLAHTDAALVPIASSDDSDSSSFHLSLSRPFVLRFEQIQPFVDELRAALKWRRRFVLSLAGATVLVNDERTRSFLALRVARGESDVLATVRCVDQCMRHFGLPVYYEDPIAHVSIASCLGDALPAHLPHDQVQTLFADGDDGAPWHTAVTTVHVAIGNRQFQLPLQS